MQEKYFLKIIGILFLLSVLITLLIALTSPSLLYRDLWMYRHVALSNFIDSNSYLPSYKELTELYLLKPEASGSLSITLHFPGSVILLNVLSKITGLPILLIINNFFISAFLIGMASFLFFNFIFGNRIFSLILSIGHM